MSIFAYRKMVCRVTLLTPTILVTAPKVVKQSGHTAAGPLVGCIKGQGDEPLSGGARLYSGAYERDEDSSRWAFA